MQFTSHIKNTTTVIFDRIATVQEDEDTSKLLHCIHSELFVMWDDKIGKAIVGEGRDVRCYAFNFPLEVQRRAHLFYKLIFRKKVETRKSLCCYKFC